MPPPRFSTSVGTSTSLVVTRRVVVGGGLGCAPGIGSGGSTGGICCAPVPKAHASNAASANQVVRVDRIIILE